MKNKKNFAVVLPLIAFFCLCTEYKGTNPFDMNRNGGIDPFSLAAAADTGFVRLSWAGIKQLKNVEKIRVYRSSSDSAHLAWINEFSGSSVDDWNDSSASPDTLYTYAVSVVAGGEESRLSAVATAQAYVLNRPRLTVSRDTVDFDTTSQSVEILISNTGSDTLSYTVNDPVVDWVDVRNDVHADAVAGEAPKSIELRPDHAKAPLGVSTTTINVVSDKGETRSIFVRIRRLAGPMLATSLAADTLDFGTLDSSKSFTLSNTGTGTLSYILTKPNYAWMTIGGDTIKSLAAAASGTVNVTIDRSTLTQSGIRVVDIPVTSTEGGNVTVHVKIVVSLPVSTDLRIADTGVTRVSLSWDKANGPVFTQYELYRDTVSSVGKTSVKVGTFTSVNDTSVVDSGLVSFKNYWYRLYLIAGADDTAGDAVAVKTLPERTLSGVVTDRKTSLPVDGAVVSVGNDSVTTVNGGEWAIYNGDTGRVVVGVRASGHLNNADTVTVKGFGTTFVSVDLLSDLIPLTLQSTFVLPERASFRNGSLAVFDAGSDPFTSPRIVLSNMITGDEISDVSTVTNTFNSAASAPVRFAVCGNKSLMGYVEGNPEIAAISDITDPMSSVDTVDLDAMPILEMQTSPSGSFIVVTRNMGNSDLSIVSIDTQTLAPTTLYTFAGSAVPNYTSIGVGQGVTCTMVGDTLFGVVGSTGLCKVFRYCLSTNQGAIVDCDITQLSDIAVIGERILVSSANQDTILCFNRTLEPLSGISISSPVNSIAVCTSGLFSGCIAAGTSSMTIEILSPFLNQPVDSFSTMYDIRNVRFAPDGSRLAILESNGTDGRVVLYTP